MRKTPVCTATQKPHNLCVTLSQSHPQLPSGRPPLSQGRLVSNFILFSKPTCVTSNKQLLIKAKVLSILIYCYYLLVRMSCMHLLSKFDLQIPPSYPQTTF